MRVLLKPFSNNVFRKNAIFQINNGDNIFFNFKKKLKKSGIDIDTIDCYTGGKVDKIVFCDLPYFWEFDYWKWLLTNKKKSVLFAFESPLVSPLSHIKFFYNFFDSIYSWNDDLVDNKKIKKFYLSNLNTNLNVKEYPFSKKKLICIINSNKNIPLPFLMASPYKENLYEKRLEAIKFFEKNIPRDFDLYGRRWDKVQRLSYRGMISRDQSAKIGTLSKYKFNLCFENCVAPGYISEKLFDCFKAHTVPVYYGSPNITGYIPANCFIDFRKFSNFASLVDYLVKMDHKTYSRYVRNGKKLIKNPKIKNRWFEDGFKRKFVDAISS